MITAEGVPTLEAPVTDVAYRLGEAIRVTGFSLPHQVLFADDLTVGIRIEATQPLYEDYVLFFHLLDETGQPIAQNDSPVLSGDWTTAALIPGYPLGFERTMDLPDDLRPGKYHLVMGMYSYPSLTRLAAQDGQDNLLPDNLLEVGGIEILPNNYPSDD